MRISPRHLVVLAALAASPVPLAAQGAVRVSAPGTELRGAPDGARVATLSRGASLAPGATSGAWREVTLEGWIPARAVAPAGSGGRLAVQGSATLHAAPDGAAVATAAGGMVLREVERRGTWVRVRRTGWVRADRLGTASASREASRPKSADQPRSAAAPTSRPARDTASRRASSPATRPAASTASRPAASTPTRPAAPSGTPTARTATARPAASTVASARPAASADAPARPAATATPAVATPGTAVARSTAAAAPRRDAVVLHSAPGGVEVAAVEPGAPVQVLARQGEWTRVRVEGWTRAPVTGTPTAAVAGRPVTLAALRADPDAFVGRPVEWTLRFVSVQVADSVRSDFQPGEPFVLARDPNGETGFVYVAVSPQQAAAMRRFTPLQPFRMTGRIRVPRSPLMGHPIVELVRLR